MLYYLGKGTVLKKEECKEYKTLKNALLAAGKDETLTVWDENGQIVGGLTDKVPDGALDTNPDGSVNAYDESGHFTGTVDAATVAELTGNEPEAVENGLNEDELESELPKAENSENEENTEPQGDRQDFENGDGQQDAHNTSGESAEITTEEQDEAEPEKSTPETKTGENGANTEAQDENIIVPQGTMKVTVICDGTLNLRRSAEWGNNNICGRASRGQSYYVKEIHTVNGKKMVRTIDDIYLSGESGQVQFEQL